jgi:hypothetical protein
LGKGEQCRYGCFGLRAPARFVYRIGCDLECRLKTAAFVKISLQAGSRTCQSSEKFFLFNILGLLRSLRFPQT